MEPSLPSPTSAAVSSSRNVLLTSLVLVMSVCTAWAQSGESGAVCVDTFVGQATNCTANDVSTELVEVVQILDGCDGPEDTASVVLEITLRNFAQVRYDIGVFFALDGDSAQTGSSCYHDYLDPPLSTTPTYGDVNQNGLSDISNGPWYDADDDLCGDLDASTEAIKTLVPLQLACRDITADGFLDLEACTGWRTSEVDDCETVSGAAPDTPAKCKCETVNLNAVAVPPATTTTSTTTSTTSTTTNTIGPTTTSTTTTTTSTTTTTTTTSTSTTTTTLPATGCSPFALEGCQPALSTKSKLLVRRGSGDPSKDEMSWDWKSSASVAKADFGTPTSTTAYEACVYAGGLLQVALRVPSASECDAASCWKETKSGYRYVNDPFTFDGVVLVDLVAGAKAGDGRIDLDGEGPALGLPAGAMALPVVLQLSREDDRSKCWQATYSQPGTNDAQRFSAVSD